MRKDSFVRHTFSILVGRLALPVGAFLILIAIGRVSDQLLGEYALVTTYYFVLQTLPLLGLTPFYMRELARRPEHAGSYFVTFAALAIASSALINVAVNIGVDNTLYSEGVNRAIRIVGITTLPGILAFLAEITLISLHRSRGIAKIAVTENVLRVVTSILVVYLYRDIVSIVWVLFATRCISLALYLLVLRLEEVAWTTSRLDYDLLLLARKVAPVFLLNTGLALALSRLDFILLSFFETIEVIGYYAIGYRIFEIAGIALSAILAAVFPVLSRKFHRDKHQFVALLRVFLPALVLLLSGVALVGFELSDEYVATLFANQYPQSVAISQLFMLLIVVQGVDQILSHSLNAVDRQGSDTLAMALGVPVYGAVLLALIPSYGMLGAYAAAAVTIVFQAWLRVTLLRKSLEIRVFSNAELAGLGAAFFSMVAIVAVATPTGFFANVAQAGLAFAAAALVLRVFGLLQPLRAMAYLFARDAPKHDDVTTLTALSRFLAHDYLRFARWWRRKLGGAGGVHNFGFVAVALLRVSRYLDINGQGRLGRIVWHLNTLISKSDVRPGTRIGSGAVFDAPVALGISGVVGRSATFFAHSALGCHGKRDIGAGPGLPLVGDRVTLQPRAYVLGPLVLEDGWTVGAHAAILRLRQIRQALDDRS